MSDITLDQIIQLVDQLSEADRLALAKHLRTSSETNFEEIPPMTPPKGVPGTSLLRFVGMIPKEDLDEMAKAIEEGCENIDWDTW